MPDSGGGFGAARGFESYRALMAECRLPFDYIQGFAGRTKCVRRRHEQTAAWLRLRETAEAAVAT